MHRGKQPAMGSRPEEQNYNAEKEILVEKNIDVCKFNDHNGKVSYPAGIEENGNTVLYDEEGIILTLNDYRGLNKNEKELLRLLAKGYTSKKISKELGLSERTIEWYRQKIALLFGLNSSRILPVVAVKIFSKIEKWGGGYYFISRYFYWR